MLGLRRRHAAAGGTAELGSPTPGNAAARTTVRHIEPIRLHALRPEGEIDARVDELLAQVGLPRALRHRFATELSGGQVRRVAVARALACEPRVIVADESVAGLDVSVQAQLLNLLRDLQRTSGIAMVFVTHDLGVAAYLCEQVAVMYLGRVVEMGPTAQILQAPRHPYTRALMRAFPRFGTPLAVSLQGEIPSPADLPSGCRFRTRCSEASRLRAHRSGAIAAGRTAPRGLSASTAGRRMITTHVPNPARGVRGMAVAPNALAAQSAVGVLRDGGNAVEAMVAAAATIAVVYPHMNGIGGDGFWLIARPGEAPRALEGCGAAAQAATIDSYRAQGLQRIPFRGGLAANTVAGTVSGWDAALRWSGDALGGRLPLTRLLHDAIAYARDGVPVTRSQSACTAELEELRGLAGFAATFAPDGAAPAAGTRWHQPRMAATLEQLARNGLEDFYRGELAQSLARDLAAAGSPLTRADLQAHRAVWSTPLALAHSRGTLYNTPPPTQGLVSLLILGQLDRLFDGERMDPWNASFVHACIEATKQAFAVRDRHVTDPAYMTVATHGLLAPAQLDAMAAHRPAAPRPGASAGPGRHRVDGRGRRRRRGRQLLSRASTTSSAAAWCCPSRV
jgi:oligopeptide/dipeptide ABC transporter ATP-binding protein